MAELSTLGAVIKAAYEGEADTNAFTDAEKAKLAAVDEGGVADGDKGDISVAGSGATWTIDNNAVTLAKMADMATASFIGRATGGTGDPEILSAAQARSVLNVEDGATADQTGAEIKAAYEAEADTNAFTDALLGKLDGIEASATADQTGAEIKAAYEAEANTNAFTDAEKSKLAGIEASATADQTGAEIKTAYEAEANTNAFTDSEKSKLAGIESGATADQSNAEIETAYNAQVAVASQVEAEAGTLTTVRRWTPERIKQAIDALGGGGGGGGGGPSGALVAVGTYEGTDQSAVDIPLEEGADHYLLKGWMKSRTDAQALWLRVTDDGFSTVETGLNYQYREDRRAANDGIFVSEASEGQSYIEICGLASGNGANEESHFTMEINHPETAGLMSRFSWVRETMAGTGTHQIADGSGLYEVAGAINGIRLLSASGNVDYKFTLYRYDPTGVGGVGSVSKDVNTAAYTFVASDAGKNLIAKNASNGNWTIDAADFSLDQEGTIFVENTGLPTLVAAAGTTLLSRGGALTAAGQYSKIGWKIRAATTIEVFGDVA